MYLPPPLVVHWWYVSVRANPILDFVFCHSNIPPNTIGGMLVVHQCKSQLHYELCTDRVENSEGHHRAVASWRGWIIHPFWQWISLLLISLDILKLSPPRVTATESVKATNNNGETSPANFTARTHVWWMLSLASSSTLFSPRYRSRIAFYPLLFLSSYLSQPLTSPSVLDDLIWNGSPPGYGLWYGPCLHCPSTSRFPDPRNLPSIGLSPSWFIPHFFLIPVLESRTDNLDIQVKFGGLPSMSSLSPPHVPLIAITWKYRITSDTLRPLARTTSIFVILPSTSILWFVLELLLFYLDLLCLWSMVIITLTIWSSLTRLHFLLILCSSGIYCIDNLDNSIIINMFPPLYDDICLSSCPPYLG